MSPSAKPRFAGRQPSSRWGAPGDDPAAPVRCGKRESEEQHVMTATPTRSTAAVWRPGDPVGERRFASIGDLVLEREGVLPDVTVAYETWGTLSPSGETPSSSSTPSPATATSSARSAPGTRRPAGGPASSVPARPSTPTGSSSSRATSSAGARAPPGLPRPRPTVGRGAGASPSSRSATRSTRRRPSPTRWASSAGTECWAAPWAGCGRWSGSRRTPTGSSGPWSSRPPPMPPPTRWRGASPSCSRSVRIRHTGVATTTAPTTGP